jgi:hypothetical protein
MEELDGEFSTVATPQRLARIETQRLIGGIIEAFERVRQRRVGRAGRVSGPVRARDCGRRRRTGGGRRVGGGRINGRRDRETGRQRKQLVSIYDETAPSVRMVRARNGPSGSRAGACFHSGRCFSSMRKHLSVLHAAAPIAGLSPHTVDLSWVRATERQRIRYICTLKEPSCGGGL